MPSGTGRETQGELDFMGGRQRRKRILLPGSIGSALALAVAAALVAPGDATAASIMNCLERDLGTVESSEGVGDVGGNLLYRHDGFTNTCGEQTLEVASLRILVKTPFQIDLDPDLLPDTNDIDSTGGYPENEEQLIRDFPSFMFHGANARNESGSNPIPIHQADDFYVALAGCVTDGDPGGIALCQSEELILFPLAIEAGQDPEEPMIFVISAEEGLVTIEPGERFGLVTVSTSNVTTGIDNDYPERMIAYEFVPEPAVALLLMASVGVAIRSHLRPPGVSVSS